MLDRYVVLYQTHFARAPAAAARHRGRAGAIAWSRRAGARARHRAGRQPSRLRQLRYGRHPLVAHPQCRRAGDALPRRRGECGGLSEGWPHRHRRRRRPHRHLDAGQAEARYRADRRHRSDRRPCRLARRQVACVRLLGSYRAAVAARRWQAARARRPHPKRQRRRLCARRQQADQRGLRQYAAHLADERRRSDGPHAGIAAQHGGGCPRRRDRHRAAPAARSISCRPRARCGARCRPRRRR